MTQVPLAVQAVHAVVAKSVFDDGYMIVAHSQGGAVSCAVIEEMDDHKVKRYVSMAGIQNGIFTGSYEADAPAAAGYVFLTAGGLQLSKVRTGEPRRTVLVLVVQSGALAAVRQLVDFQYFLSRDEQHQSVSTKQ